MRYLSYDLRFEGNIRAMSSSKEGGIVNSKLLSVKLLATDVDGVLTNGAISYDETGNETKQFNVSDGLGIVLLAHAGIPVVWITGRASRSVLRRAEELKVVECLTGIRDKGAALHFVCNKLDIDLSNVLYIGDDWNDIPALRISGMSAAPQNAALEVLQIVDWRIEINGGEGVLRAACNAILDAQGRSAEIMESYLESLKQSSSTVH